MEHISLNAVCPYFTMFPLEFPLGILAKHARPSDVVLDPFCGRGTTNFAARLLGLDSLGVDSSPVAVAITHAKLVQVEPDEIVNEARLILDTLSTSAIPDGEFWSLAYHSRVLSKLCVLRSALIHRCRSNARVALRGILLGALHGPKQKTFPSYFSNQCPRTYAPKPGYAVKFWKKNKLRPEYVDVVKIIERRAIHYYSAKLPPAGHVRRGDSRRRSTFWPRDLSQRYQWIITSPPYYGMRTYIPDQWIRNWFLGGPAGVDYAGGEQLSHLRPDDFTDELREVWSNVASASSKSAKLVMRFGGIADRNVEPLELAKQALKDSGWRLETVRSAGSAPFARRQANTFVSGIAKQLAEYDLWARRDA